MGGCGREGLEGGGGAGVFAVAIALGCGHTCAIMSKGGVKCWGLNANGQLGIGSRMDATRPADVAGE